MFGANRQGRKLEAKGIITLYSLSAAGVLSRNQPSGGNESKTNDTQGAVDVRAERSDGDEAGRKDEGLR